MDCAILYTLKQQSGALQMATTINLTTAKTVLNEASIAAATATQTYLAEHGDRDCCGFAWVTVYKVRSNSKLGKLLAELGFSKAYGGGLQLWNPSKHFTQALTAKEKGAETYARILRDALGLEAYAQSRMD